MTSASTAAGKRAKPSPRAAARAAAERTAARARTTKAASEHRRIVVVYDIDAPRVRLGIAWFVVVVVALGLGEITVAAVYGLAAAIAAAQTAKAWRKTRRRERPFDALAAAVAVGLPIAAALSTPLLGLALLAAVAACVASAPLPSAARTFQCGVWPGAAAAAVVVSYRFEPWSAAALLLAVSAYETGDYLVGSGAKNALEGPIAGALAALIVQFGVSAVGFPPFELPSGFAFAALAAALCPAGQLVASLVLPDARAPASALRRLDSLLVLAPVWAFLVGLQVA